MGSAESREGRRAYFGMDQEERVRVLQGIRVSGRPAGGRGGVCRRSPREGREFGGRRRPGLLRVGGRTETGGRGLVTWTPARVRLGHLILCLRRLRTPKRVRGQRVAPPLGSGAALLT